ncbi:CynX/NimT family MFS transporter [Pseudomonas sp. NPDC089554]|uniref:MFS transporter n=1 Tax=Pseudomonas sp. NPDC089554 TaxID=3390653 RepID=UPI003D0626BF
MPAEPLPATPRAPSMLVLVACIVLVAITLRPGIVSVGPLLPAIILELGLSHTEAALLTVIPTLLMGVLALPAPWLAHRYGRDRVILAALLVMGLAITLRTFAGSAGQLFAATAGVGAGIAIAGTLFSSYVKARAPGRLALFMGLYATAIGMGSTFAAASTGLLEQLLQGWRWASGAWVLPVLLAALAWVIVERRSLGSRPTATATAKPKMPWGNATAWLIALFFACNNLVFYALIAWLAPLYSELGESTASAGLILASYTLGFMVANPVFGFLSRSDDRRLLLAASSSIALLGSLAMAVSPSSMPLVIVPIAAFGTGGAFTLAMTLPLDNASTPEEAGTWNAFVMLISYLVGAAGPLVMGYLRDSTGNFQSALWLLVGVGAVMLLVTPFLQPYHQRARRQCNP